MKNTWVYGVIGVVALLMCACNSNHTRFYTDLSDSEVPALQIDRFDLDLFEMDTTALRAKYGRFLDLYLWQVMGLKNCDRLPEMLADTSVQSLVADIRKVYTDEKSETIAAELTTAMRYYKHYFPQGQVPRLQFHFSGYNQCIVTDDSLLSASVDNYLGSDYPDYQYIAYQYELPDMTPERLPVDMMTGWLLSDMSSFGFAEPNGNLLENMVFYGKLMYLLKVCFPERNEYEILGYTSEEYAWCKRHEAHVWGFVAERNELFSDDRMVLAHYMHPGPFTPGLVEESPGRIGYYIGLRIVESFVNRNKDLRLPEIVFYSDAQQLLQESHYKP
ncbi:MAG: hypothetical protein J5808_03475 [Paludibacteraceae bacterium]|nr:hypothetical protein [Paludibacteraceae bacterium]